MASTFDRIFGFDETKGERFPGNCDRPGVGM